MRSPKEQTEKYASYLLAIGSPDLCVYNAYSLMVNVELPTPSGIKRRRYVAYAGLSGAASAVAMGRNGLYNRHGISAESSSNRERLPTDSACRVGSAAQELVMQWQFMGEHAFLHVNIRLDENSGSAGELLL